MNLRRTTVLACCLLALSPISSFAGEVATESRGGISGADIPDVAEVASFQIDLGTLGVVNLEKGPVVSDTTARQDRLVLRKPGTPSPETLFETKGRRLVAIAVATFSNPGSKDLLLTLDPGGSGGFIEFVLLGASGTSLLRLWEPEAIKGGAASFQQVEGKTVLFVDSLEISPAKKEASKISTAYRWENGAMVEGEAVKTPIPTIPVIASSTESQN
ncbi:MAG: hypothetical protein WA705_28460 [Candidatus Ozemobacteraceae bacterium]